MNGGSFADCSFFLLEYNMKWFAIILIALGALSCDVSGLNDAIDEIVAEEEQEDK